MKADKYRIQPRKLSFNIIIGEIVLFCQKGINSGSGGYKMHGKLVPDFLYIWDSAIKRNDPAKSKGQNISLLEFIDIFRFSTGKICQTLFKIVMESALIMQMTITVTSIYRSLSADLKGSVR